MAASLFRLFRRTLFMVFPFALGASAYFVHQAFSLEGQAAGVAELPPKAEAALGLEEFRSFEADLALLALAEAPSDLCSDELGAIYVLQRDGRILRIAGKEAGEGATLSASTLYADLARLGAVGIGEEAEGAEGAEDDGGPAGGLPADYRALAMHPDFLVPDRPGFGRFYAVVGESAGTASADFRPEFGSDREHHQDVLYEYVVAHPLSARFRGIRREVLRLSQPGPDHNLESLAFDSLGRLYLAVGDGASGKVASGAPSNNASSLANAYGKILRIDPLGDNAANGRYGIPESNPFRLVTEALPELWAFGLRSPHRLHYDPYLQSIGIHETSPRGVGRLHFSRRGAEHFGWDLSEVSGFFQTAQRSRLDEIVTAPVLSLAPPAPGATADDAGAAPSAGSVVYRGERFPALAGRLVVAASGGRVVVAPASGAGLADPPAVYRFDSLGGKEFAAIKTSRDGEILLLCTDGSLYEVRKHHASGRTDRQSKPLYCAVSDPVGAMPGRQE